MNGHATVPAWALEALAGDGQAGLAAVATLCALCRLRAAADSTAWPSVATLARMTGMSVRTVSDALRRLERHRVIARAAAETGKPVVYHVSMRAPEPRQPTADPLGSPLPTPPRQPTADTSASVDTKPRQPAADKQNYKNTPAALPTVEQQVSAAAVAASAGDGLADRFDLPAHRDAYAGVRRAARNPVALDATLEQMRDGLDAPAGGSLSWYQLGQGLLELCAAGEPFSPRLLRGFARRCPAVPPAPGTERAAAPTTADLQRRRDLLAIRLRNRARAAVGERPEPEPAWAPELLTRHAAWFAAHETAA
jgi:hypothetical protein